MLQYVEGAPLIFQGTRFRRLSALAGGSIHVIRKLTSSFKRMRQRKYHVENRERELERQRLFHQRCGLIPQ